jgi:replication factor A1
MEISKTKKIAEINSEMLEISLKAKILSISKRETQNSKGPLTYFYGLIGDETGVFPFTAWSMPTTVRESDVYEISKCYTKSFKEKLRIYFDNRTEFKFLNEEMDVKRTYKYFEIKDLDLKEKFVTVEGLLQSENIREYEKDGEKRKVFQYILKDQSATIPLSSFGMQLETGKYARIEGARLDEFNGYYRLNISDKAKVEYLKVDLNELDHISHIGDLKSPIGGIKVSGFIISMGEKSGLIARCAECKQKIDDIRCADHPEAKLIFDIFCYFTIDDGTDYLQVSAGYDALKNVTNISQDYLNNEKRPPLKREVKEKLNENLLHHVLVIKGNLKLSVMGLTLRSTEVSFLGDKEIVELKSNLEEVIN